VFPRCQRVKITKMDFGLTALAKAGKMYESANVPGLQMNRRIIGLSLIGVTTLVVVAAAFRPWAAPALAPLHTTDPQSPPSQPPANPEKFAQDRDPASGMKPIPFDGERALKSVKQFCDLGPRISGSEAIKKQREIMIKHFETLGAKVTLQNFDAKQKSRKEKVAMTNIIASWYPDLKKRIIFCCHYDTRPIADQESNRQNWNKPFVSANDGTSGVAMMMELAQHMKSITPSVGVDFVFFDGEEYVFDTNPVTGDDYFLGSDYFAKSYAKDKGKLDFTYEAALLFDLCHHDHAVLQVEAYSYQFAPEIVQQVWKVAEQAGAKSFKYERGFEVRDDHLALNAAGIKAVDIIDFSYSHWHKLTDTTDKISAKQMAEVANVAMTWLRIVK
jgi:glutaminyl-peptide cyclotransferase